MGLGAAVLLTAGWRSTLELFFFSSRRRHTRCSRDWSSDVCSSDLSDPARGRRAGAAARGGGDRRGSDRADAPLRRGRSEERRVGKSVDLGGRRIIKKKNISTPSGPWSLV